VLLLVLAALLIAWGLMPERTEGFFGRLPYGNSLLKALARIDLILWQPDLGQKDLVQEDQEMAPCLVRSILKLLVSSLYESWQWTAAAVLAWTLQPKFKSS
jgi:hypothetical protein